MGKQRSAAKPALFIAGIVFCFLLIALLVCYFCTASYYARHFFPGTMLNGIAVDKLTAQEAEEKVAQEVAAYVLDIKTRDDEEYRIIGKDIAYVYVPGTEIRELLKAQEHMKWITLRSGRKELDLDVSTSYDKDRLNRLVAQLGCFLPENITKPKDAFLRKTETGYALVEAVDGNELKLAKVQELAVAAVDAGDEKLQLADDAYEEPKVKSDDKRIVEALAKIQDYLNTVVRYDVGESGEVLDYKTIKEWIAVGDDFSVTIDESKVADYVQHLASEYNTFGSVREFRTSKGDTVKVGGGDYGWVIDKEKERAQLLQDLEKGKEAVREPMFNQMGAVKSRTYDIGNTYLEIDYTNQHMYYYVNGELKLESDVVTGNIRLKNGSPDGVYRIVYKERDATLVGEDYQSDVNYFMVFAYNVGFHDATWRTQFGGQIYKESGSHGCVNMPFEKAKELFEMLETGTPVVAYYREPVELTAENAKISNAYSYKSEEKEE